MQAIAMEFDSRDQLNEAVEKLWVTGKATGELVVKPLSGGRWRLDLTSETPIKDKMLEKLPGKLLTGAAAGAKGDAADAAEGDDAEPEAEAEAAAADES